MYAVLSLHKHHASGEDKEGVGDVKQGCIEDSLWSENGAHDGIAYEAHICKHKGEAYHALLIMVLGYEFGHSKTENQQEDVGQEAYAYEWQDESSVGQSVAHY